jgi:hypothetical protein
MLNTQIGYTLTGTYSGKASQTSQVQVGSFNLPANQGVWFISLGWTLTAEDGMVIVLNKNIVISATSASNTPLNQFGGWQFYEELNDGGYVIDVRRIDYLGGTYVKTTTGVQPIFINSLCDTNGGDVTISGGYSATRIG